MQKYIYLTTSKILFVCIKKAKRRYEYENKKRKIINKRISAPLLKPESYSLLNLKGKISKINKIIK